MSQYDEPEFEPQEHDELAIKLNELINEAVKAKIQQTVEGLEYSTKRNEELQKQIYELHRTIRNHEPEMNKKLKEKELEVKRTLCGGLAIGDKVFYPKAHYKSIPCASCEGTGKVTAKIGDEEIKVTCPKCSYGKNSSTTYMPQEDKVSSVHFEMNDARRWLSFYLAREDQKRELGTIFKTIEECQAHCDERNKPKEPETA